MDLHRQEVRRRAVSGVWVAILGVLMLSFVGLAIDTSFYVYTAQQLQNAADGAALGAAHLVRDGMIEANDRAIQIAAANIAANDPVLLAANYENNLEDPDIELGNWDRETGVFTSFDPANPPPPPGPFDEPFADRPNAVRVSARRTEGSLGGQLPLLFGPVVGVSTTEVSRSAIAMSGGGTGAGLITLAPDGSCSLRFNGNNDLIIDSAPGYEGEAVMQVNSSDPCAVCGSGSSLTIQADEMNVVGHTCFNGNPTLNVDIQEEQPYVDDPLASLLPPTWDPSLDLGCVPCGRACNSGPLENRGCLADADCPPNEGDCTPVDCPPLAVCNTATTCVGGDTPGVPCTGNAECPNGVCSTPLCAGGPNAGLACLADTDCPPNDGDCTPVVCPALATCTKTGITACEGGSNDDLMCQTDADCPGGGICVLSDHVTLDPGYYSGGFRVTSSGTTLTLNPGVYVVDNVDGGVTSGFYINGGNIIAHEVMIYATGDSVVYLGGNGTVDITPSSDENDPYWGISIFQARDNDNDATIIGTSDMNLEGTYYYPYAELELGGTGIALGNQLVAWDMWIHGNGTFTINYDGRFKAPGFKVFLVH